MAREVLGGRKLKEDDGLNLRQLEARIRAAISRVEDQPTRQVLNLLARAVVKLGQKPEITSNDRRLTEREISGWGI